MKTREIAEYLSGELTGDGDVEISRVAALDSATTGEIAFAEKSDGVTETRASCLLAPLDFTGDVSATVIRIKNPKLAFALIAKKITPYKSRFWKEHKSSETQLKFVQIADSADVRTCDIGEFVSIGENSYVGEGCEIADGVRIGNNVVIKKFSIIYANCVIYDDVEVGYDCVIHAGTVIGADGFGYVRDEQGEYHQFPQIGTVVIEDNVEIGANSCIDRGALGETRIGEGTKIDNLVQIAHNVQIGKRVVIAAQTGISGSTVIEDDCVIGGQVGMGDHARVLSGAIIGSQAGVLPGKIVRQGVWWGTPVQPLDEYKRQNAMLKGIGRLKDEVKELKKKLSE